MRDLGGFICGIHPWGRQERMISLASETMYGLLKRTVGMLLMQMVIRIVFLGLGIMRRL